MTFVKVVQAGSFSAAARDLKMPVSTVSTKIARLESELEVSLLRRTTRKLHLTEAGQRFFAHAVRAVSELQQAQASISSNDGAPHGLLRITATIDMGATSLSSIVADFLKVNPLVRIELVLTDRIVDLVGEGIDLAIRTGPLKDSSLVSRKLAMTHFEAFASPAYLKKNGIPKKPHDLEKHECLRFTLSETPELWNLVGNGKAARIAVKSRLGANNFAALHRMVLSGAGIGLLPTFLCKDDVKENRLTPVLEGWTGERFPVSVVYPKQSHVPTALRAFVDYLTEHLVEAF